MYDLVLGYIEHWCLASLFFFLSYTALLHDMLNLHGPILRLRLIAVISARTRILHIDFLAPSFSVSSLPLPVKTISPAGTITVNQTRRRYSGAAST